MIQSGTQPASARIKIFATAASNAASSMLLTAVVQIARAVECQLLHRMHCRAESSKAKQLQSHHTYALKQQVQTCFGLRRLHPRASGHNYSRCYTICCILHANSAQAPSCLRVLVWLHQSKTAIWAVCVEDFHCPATPAAAVSVISNLLHARRRLVRLVAPACLPTALPRWLRSLQQYASCLLSVADQDGKAGRLWLCTRWWLPLLKLHAASAPGARAAVTHCQSATSAFKQSSCCHAKQRKQRCRPHFCKRRRVPPLFLTRARIKCPRPALLVWLWITKISRITRW
jgi:hypothetical protein